MVPFVLIEEYHLRTQTSFSCIIQAMYPLKVPWYTAGFE